MKKRLLKIALLLLAVLTTGSVNATEYNFEGLSNKTAPTKGDQVTVGGLTMWKLKYVKDGEETKEFDGKFAYGARTNGVDAAANYRFMNEANYKGLEFIYSDRTFAILGLTNGQRIKITTHQGGLSFVGQPALSGVASGATVGSTYYTVSTSEATVDILLKSDENNTEIKTVEILDATTTETVTVGVAGYSNTYNFKDATAIAIDNSDENTSKARSMFDGKFSITAKYSSDLQLTSEYGFKVLYAEKPITIYSLTKGETITFNFTNGEDSKGFKISGTSILEGLNDGDALASGTTYNVTASGDLIITNETKNPTIQSIVIAKAEQNIGGATLVSENALDFTDVTEIEAYVATAASAGTVTFNRVYKVAAETPLYLKANAAVSVDVPVLDGDSETISTNLLKGSASATTPLTSTDDTKYYVFGVLDDVAGFYPVSTEGTLTSAAGKAYLKLTAAQASLARSIRMVFDDVTGINTVKENEGNKTGDNIWYTLQGARVAKPTHGIYIRNGKKIFIK